MNASIGLHRLHLLPNAADSISTFAQIAVRAVFDELYVVVHERQCETHGQNCRDRNADRHVTDEAECLNEGNVEVYQESIIVDQESIIVDQESIFKWVGSKNASYANNVSCETIIDANI